MKKSQALIKTIVLAMGKEIKQNINYNINTTEKISYCATCDGFFYRNKKVAIIGNSEFTLSEYNHLKNVTSDITILANSKNVNNVLKNIKNINNNLIKNINSADNDKVEVEFENSKKKKSEGRNKHWTVNS